MICCVVLLVLACDKQSLRLSRSRLTVRDWLVVEADDGGTLSKEPLKALREMMSHLLR